MSDAALPALPTRQAIEARDRTAPGKVTGKLKRALDAMVWEALKRDEAAISAGMSVHGLREALKRPHVKAYYLNQLDVLRNSERARNIHALVDVRDASGNAMARVNAVKALEQLENEQHGGGARQAMPGLVVIIEQPSPYVSHMGHERQIEAKPLKDNE